MRVLFINPVCGQGSTGRICTGIADLLKSQGHEAYIAYGLGSSDYPNSINISAGRSDYLFHNIMSRLTDSEGLHSTKQTLKLISYIKEIKPDVVHLHTLHGHYLNYVLLLKCLRTQGCPVVLTLHDCWLFTGHCAHFDQFGCEKWKTECHNCEHLEAYPQSFFLDRSRKNFNRKKELLLSLGINLTVVPVSFWLENLVHQSFLKELNIKTIHNGINLNMFHPYVESNRRALLGIPSTNRIVLGVALPWSRYKGLPDFHKLRAALDESYSIIMVGLSEEQKAALPDGIIGICRTDNVQELAEIYSISDVLVNTTYCDNYPTVNLEAMSCGTPVITYRTGGSPEAISVDTGRIVPQGDLDDFVLSIKELLSIDRNTNRENCVNRSKKFFDQNECFGEYVSLYKSLI
ncbi:glycosyltransferase [uncultured Bacteroides sp.]|uniref:glycosyltransferase n=1 Tax=uncultured Bacteroides sp. TaxID=162156 RepID=UPI002AAAB555|nr:glycosyltransferase [uncultured Bacteroides sp.]